MKVKLQKFECLVNKKIGWNKISEVCTIYIGGLYQWLEYDFSAYEEKSKMCTAFLGIKIVKSFNV